MMASRPAQAEKAYSFENLPSVDGRSYSLSSFDDKQILVVIFSGNGCPTAKATEPRIMEIQRGYAEKGVQIVLINSNNSSISPPDTFTEMVKRAGEKGYNFPYLKDEDRRAARSFGAMNTPHAFVLDRERRLRYKGRVDNAREASRVTVNDLRNALDDLLAGGEVRNAETDPFGCSIVW